MNRLLLAASLRGPVARACLLASLALLGAAATQAQIKPAASGGDMLAHRVATGDTLEQLASRLRAAGLGPVSLPALMG